MDRCALFVDAGYLLADGAMAVHGTRHRDTVSWDFGGLLQLLGNLASERTGLPMLRCYWYEATVEARRSLEHEALADLPGLKLRLGRMRPGRREGVDAEIHRDLMTLARNGALAEAVLVSGDEELAQVIVDAQDFGVRVTVVHVSADGNWTISRALRQECDDLVEVSAGQLRPYVNLLSGIEAPASAAAGAIGPGSSSPSVSSSGASTSPLSNGHGTPSSIGSLQSTGPHNSPPPATPLTSPSSTSGYEPSSGSTLDFPRPSGSTYDTGSRYDTGPSGSGYEPGSSGTRYGTQPSGYGSGSSGSGYTGSEYTSGTSGIGSFGSDSGIGGSGIGSSGMGGNGSVPRLPPSQHPALGSGSMNSLTGPQSLPSPSSPPPPPLHAAPTPNTTHGTGPQYLPPSASAPPPSSPPALSPPPPALPPPSSGQSHGPYTGPQQISPVPAQQAAPTLADAVKAAHHEGQDFGESVARDAPALWLEAVLARKPRMPSDLEARLLQGSSLPIDFLLHDEVRHALRRGFWDALERSRR